jgi:sodium/hydrogen antiporter
MNANTVIVLAVVLFGWSVVSDRLAARNLTGPIVFVVAGLLLANSSWGIVTVDVESSTVHVLAEVTLGLLLFADASKVPLAAARHDLRLTSRLLGIGLPLSIVAGAALAIVAFPDLPIALAGLIAAGLAPTDAALSASVIADERLPIGVRRVLNVESGLNDGIATPVVTFCIASAATVLGIAAHHDEAGFGALQQLAVGIAIGAGIALIGGRLLTIAHRRGWMQHGTRRLATLALALLAFQIASEVGGNPFVSAFVGGLAFGAAAGTDNGESVELAELGGSLLSLVMWFVFGAGFIIPAFEDLDARVVIYAVGSLTVVRMVPVAIALLGAGQDRATVAFIGWFGPRGLASVVFALLAVEDLGNGDPRVLAAVHAIVITIVFSIIAHGLTARPLAGRYLATIEARRRRMSAPSMPPGAR